MPIASDYVGNFRANAKSNNRMIPLSVLYKLHLVDVPAAVTNGASLTHLGAAAAGSVNMTLGGSLASGGVVTFTYPRNVVITVTHATAVVAMSGVITGTDIAGKPMTEAWSVTATGVSKTFTGKKAFKTISSITEVVAADASANSIIAGSGNVLGIGVKTSQPAAVMELVDGAVVTTGTIVAASTVSTADPLGTYAPATAPNGAHDYDVYVISDDPENS
jgi:hypothetical protein